MARSIWRLLSDRNGVQAARLSIDTGEVIARQAAPGQGRCGQELV
jgi:hypothetical protein